MFFIYKDKRAPLSRPVDKVNTWILQTRVNALYPLENCPQLSPRAVF